jgi:sec-independent protein translocase protein TatA
MFGLGTTEIILILLVILIMFGASKIPEFAKSLGKGIREFKNAARDIKSEIEKETDINK